MKKSEQRGNKLKAIALIGVSSICFSLSAVNQRDLPFEKRSGELATAVRPGGTFLKSWKTGMEVRGRATYTMSGQFKMDEDATIKWWQKWRKRIEEGKVFNTYFEGEAEFETVCLLEAQREPLTPLRIIRHYQDVRAISASSTSAKWTPPAKCVRHVMQKIKEGKLTEYSNRLAEKIRRLGKSMKLAATGLLLSSDPTGISKVAGGVVSGIGQGAEVGANYLQSENGQEYIENINKLLNEQFEKQGIKIEDGIFEITPDSPAWTNFPMLKEYAENIENLKGTITEEFDHRSYYIRSADFSKVWEMSGKKFSAIDDIADLKTMDAKIKALKDFEIEYEPTTNSLAKGTIERETFSLDRIFDNEQRDVGEEWVLDGQYFDSFLHPDLRGSFNGQIWLRYDNDEEIEIEEANKRILYDAQCLTLLNKNKKGRNSTLTYSEGKGRFTASMNSDTKARMWVDKESGHVLRVEMILKGNAETLPNMKITAGYKAVGQINLTINYEAQVGKSSK